MTREWEIKQIFQEQLERFLKVEENYSYMISKKDGKMELTVVKGDEL